MQEDLKTEAVKNLKKEKAKRRGVYTVGVIFTAVSIILFTISLSFPSDVAYWIKFPILPLVLVYGIVYFAAFGVPFLTGEGEISEEDIEREMVKIYKLQNKNLPLEDNMDELELKEIETIKKRYEDDEDFV